MKRQDWHPEDIKAAVRKTGITLTRLAVENGLSSSACRKALVTPVPRADRLIAARIGKPLHVLWPSRYGPKNERRKFTNVNNHIRGARDSHSQKHVRVLT